MRCGLVVSLLLGAAWGCGSSSPPDRLGDLPAVVLWAWERPEDLSFLNPQKAAVAYLAGTVLLRGEDVEVRPRAQPLQVAEGTRMIAVIRVEAPVGDTPVLSDGQIESSVNAICRLAELPDLAALQIDFDAVESQRDFYRRFLESLRSKLHERLPLSITALASWCLGDPWIGNLPIDEAVPMLFQMGPDTAEVRHLLAAGRDFQAPACRLSAGIATDEPLPRLPRGRRIYVFHSQKWDRSSVEAAIGEAEKWR